MIPVINSSASSILFNMQTQILNMALEITLIETEKQNGAISSWKSGCW